ncbi:MAG: hypothetical protein UT91_C0028G0010 [Parcubacteria group bacterium GW2011_GWA2_40_23]|nr:MAG: hypothetical protein UT91_C0028G0010 [Parcubacteria group bacterium GW2011_GWA2_40_23]
MNTVVDSGPPSNGWVDLHFLLWQADVPTLVLETQGQAIAPGLTDVLLHEADIIVSNLVDDSDVARLAIVITGIENEEVVRLRLFLTSLRELA